MRYSGFTLFFNPGNKKWQLSVRPEGEAGWIVDYVSEAQAQRVLRGLERDPASSLEDTAAELAAAIRRRYK